MGESAAAAAKVKYIDDLPNEVLSIILGLVPWRDVGLPAAQRSGRHEVVEWLAAMDGRMLVEQGANPRFFAV
jgi:hypothetical protein